jgi:hypothetical protein
LKHSGQQPQGKHLNNRIISAALASVTMALVPAAASAVTLFTSDFETVPTIITGGSGYQIFNNGATIDGWTVGDTSVDLIQGAYGAITGFSVDLAGSPGPGSLSRTYNQVAGQTYTLQWDYFKNSTGDVLDVTFGGVTTSFAVAAAPVLGQTLSYTALTNNAAAAVTFRSVGTPIPGNYAGATIDNISVSVVPEPEGYGLALAGMAAVFASRRFWRQTKPA